MINQAKFEAELAAAGVVVKGFCDAPPHEGRAVLSDGTIVPGATGTLSHETGGTPNEAGAAAYRIVLAAHDPSLTQEQQDAIFDRILNGAVGGREKLLAALTLKAWADSTAGEKIWANVIINAAGERIRDVLP